ncbi:MAG: hypothetical protein JO250_01615 [Armatimonadetes bacterium]|nr:hypothetical protein [Armatimonadota bacterium]
MNPPTAVPEQTSRLARAAFPKGNFYVRMREELGTLFIDGDFTDLYPRRGQPAFAPWRPARAMLHYGHPISVLMSGRSGSIMGADTHRRTLLPSLNRPPACVGYPSAPQPDEHSQANAKRRPRRGRRRSAYARGRTGGPAASHD